MVALVLAIALFAAWFSRASVSAVDGRTRLEMIRGVAAHGLPHLENGALGSEAPFVARWNVPRDGELWGAYPPLQAYLGAPAVALGGVPAVVREGLLFVAIAALGVFALARRLFGDPLWAALAAALLVLATPLVPASLDVAPFSLVAALVAWSAWLAAGAIDDPDAGTARALGAGALAGLACATHLLGVPLAAGTVAAIALGDARPSRRTARRAAAALAGALVALAPVSALDRVRFGTLDPFTQGPCVWKTCVVDGLAGEAALPMALYALPVVAWAGGACAIYIFLRDRSRWAPHAAVTAAVVALAAAPALRAHVSAVASVLLATTIDASQLAMPPFTRPADGVGLLFGAFVVKSPLESSPFLALAAIAPFVAPSPRLRVVVFPSIALFAAIALRANLPLVHALGYPFLHLRHVVPAAPLLVVLAVAAMRALPFASRDALLMAGVVGLSTAWLVGDASDASLLRRLFLLRATLLVGGAAAAATVLRARDRRLPRAAATLAACAVGLAVAVNVAVDVRALVAQARTLDARVADLAAVAPRRFALVGWHDELDPLLSLRASRDVEYLDLSELDDPADALVRVRAWQREGTPVYLAPPPDGRIDLPGDLAFEPAARDLLRVTR